MSSDTNSKKRKNQSQANDRQECPPPKKKAPTLEERAAEIFNERPNLAYRSKDNYWHFDNPMYIRLLNDSKTNKIPVGWGSTVSATTNKRDIAMCINDEADSKKLTKASIYLQEFIQTHAPTGTNITPLFTPEGTPHKEGPGSYAPVFKMRLPQAEDGTLLCPVIDQNHAPVQPDDLHNRPILAAIAAVTGVYFGKFNKNGLIRKCVLLQVGEQEDSFGRAKVDFLDFAVPKPAPEPAC